MFNKPATMVITSIGCVIVGIFLTSRGASQQLPKDLRVEFATESASLVGGPTIVDNSVEVIRPDGSRSIKTTRTFTSKDSATGLEAIEIKTIYDSKSDITYEIVPLLSMYGSLPGGRGRYHDITGVSSCESRFRPADNVKKIGTTNKLGAIVETYTLHRGQGEYQSTETLDMYPTYGCLVGEKISMLINSNTGTTIAKNTQRILAITEVPDDPALFEVPPKGFSQAKPSDLLKKLEELRGKECPQCLLNTGNRADEKHDRLWRQRSQKGK